MEQRMTEAKRFSLVRRMQSFVHAGRGLNIFLRTTHNAWIQILCFLGVIILGIVLNIARIDWIALLLIGVIVLVAEIINTAIEIDINLTSPEYHPYARDTKDVAAAAVLVASIFALVVGLFVFAPYL
jgi:diacylglycerol kinase